MLRARLVVLPGAGHFALVLSLVFAFSLVLGLTVSRPAAAQETSAGRVQKIVEAMAALPAFEGRWKGGGWMRRGPQEPQHFVSEEIVELKLDGQVLLIEGIHHDKADPSKKIFHAVALLSYDPAAGRYRFRSHTGEGQDSEFEGRVEDGAFIWGHEVPGGRIRYVMRIREGRWEEVGEFSRDGESWTQFFDMKLDRVK